MVALEAAAVAVLVLVVVLLVLLLIVTEVPFSFADDGTTEKAPNVGGGAFFLSDRFPLSRLPEFRIHRAKKGLPRRKSSW